MINGTIILHESCNLEFGIERELFHVYIINE